MGTVIAIIAGVISLGGAIAGVVYYIKKNAQTAATVEAVTASAQEDAARVQALQAAQTAERVARDKDFDAKATAATSPAAAAELLKQASSGS